jgi:integrase
MSNRSPVKVQGPGIPDYLYIYPHNGIYCGRRKIGAKIFPKSFKTTDLPTAKRLLKNWLTSLEERKGGQIRLGALCDMFLKSRQDRKPKTVGAYKRAIKILIKTFGENTFAHEVKPSELAAMFSKVRKGPENENGYDVSTSNAFVINTTAIFEVGVNDKLLSENPAKKVDKRTRRRPYKPKAQEIPTPQRLRKLLEYIRNNHQNPYRKDSADQAEFLALAACGEAEANNLDWADVRWDEGHIHIKERVKTGVEFFIPLFVWLRPFMERLWKNAGEPQSGKIFRFASVGEGLNHGCEALGFPRYTPRVLRKYGIRMQIRAGFRAPEVAEHQGHTDNGVLISSTYSKVFAENDEQRKKDRQRSLALPEEYSV